jgi:hypothetical protein
VASLYPKKINRKTYWYLREIARVDGKPKMVCERYLGTAARSFSRPGGLVGVLGPVVQVLRSAVLHAGYQPSVGHTVAGQLVGDQHPRHEAQPREQLTEGPGSGLGVTPRRDQNVQHDTVLVNGPPQVVALAMDRDEDLVEMPFIAWSWPPATQPVREGHRICGTSGGRSRT